MGQCGCFHGYYGSECEIQCAGGSSYPCYGKGKCDKENGTCTCDASAAVNSNCSVCSPGWFGEDCSLANTGLQGINLENLQTKGCVVKQTIFTGPSCSKLTTSLVNDSLKFTSSDTQIC